MSRVGRRCRDTETYRGHIHVLLTVTGRPCRRALPLFNERLRGWFRRPPLRSICLDPGYISIFDVVRRGYTATGGGGVLRIMHGRNRMTIAPRIPTMTEQSMVFIDQADVSRTKRERRKLFGEVCIKDGLYPTMSRLRGVNLHVDDIVEILDSFSGVATSRESNGVTT